MHPISALDCKILALLGEANDLFRANEIRRTMVVDPVDAEHFYQAIATAQRLLLEVLSKNDKQEEKTVDE